jgi:hypothetical protein
MPCVRTGLAVLLSCFMALSSVAVFPSKSKCCCRAAANGTCPMKRDGASQCAQRACTLSLANQSPAQTSAASLLPLVLAEKSEHFDSPSTEPSFATLLQQRALSRPSPPEPPPPRV